MIRKQLEEIEELFEQSEFCAAVTRMTKDKGCTGKDRKIVGDDRSVLERWMEGFWELLNEGEQEEEVGAQTTGVLI